LRQQKTSGQSSSASSAVWWDVLGKGLCSYLADVSSGHAKYDGRVVGIRKVARVDWWQVSIDLLRRFFRPRTHAVERGLSRVGER
jgi:hypothetical protein